MKIAEKLKKAMQELNLNQRQVVTRTGKSKGSVSQYLSGKQIPSEDVQSAIATSLGLASDYFTGMDQELQVMPQLEVKAGTIPKLDVAKAAKMMGMNHNTVRKGLEVGLDLARRIVKEGGLEALERECKFRGVTGIHTSLAAKDLDKASQKIKEMTIDTFTILCIAAVHDEFGFGEKRCRRLIAKMEEGAEYLMDDLATWDDYIKEIKEQLNIDLRIRWNN